MKPSRNLLPFLLGSSLLASHALAQTVTLTTSDAAGTSSYNSGLNWSDGLGPSAGKDYAVTSRQLRAPVTTSANQNFTFAGASLQMNSGGTLAWVGSTSHISGSLTVGDLILNGGNIGIFRSNATLTMAGNIDVTAQSNLNIGSAGDTTGQVRNITLDSILSGSSRLVVNAQNNSSNILTVSGNNSGFSGGFQIRGTNISNVSSTLTVGHANALGTGTITLEQGILNLNGFSTTIGGLAGDNASDNFVQNNSNTAITLTVNSGSDTTYAGAIQDGSGSGNLGLTKSGTGTLMLSGANNYTGNTTISQGILQIGNGGTTGTLGAHSDTAIASGAELQINRSTDSFGYAYNGELSGSGTVNILSERRFNFQNNNQTASGSLSFIVDGVLGINTPSGVTAVHLGELSGSGTIQRAGAAPSNPPLTLLTIGGKNTSSTYSGNITNIAEFAIEKVGSGTLTLSGVNGYGGPTTISAGTLALGAGGSINNTSGVHLGGGTFDVSAKSGYAVAKLSGNGSVVGALSVSTELAIGTSAGTINFEDLTLGGASSFIHEITGGSSAADLGIVSGSLTIDSGAILDLVQLGTYTLDDRFTLFAYQEGNLTGTFSGLSQGGTFTAAGGLWQIDYFDTTAGLNADAGDGTRFVNITAIPEPRAALLGGLGLLALLRRRRS